MNIDIESIGLLSLILRDSPKDRQLILCILARSNTVPTRITFNPNTDYPIFYGYSNSKISLYLMGKGIISNVPREGYIKRLLSSHYLSYAETVINGAKNWDIHQKLMSVSKFITLDNKTTYKDAEVFLVFRDKALDYIKDYATSHNEEASSFLGIELSGEVSKTVTNSEVYYPQTIPDRTEEFIRLAREASVREHQRSLDDRNRRQDAKTARILASTKDKYLHAVDLISEYAEMAKNSQTTQYADNGTTFSIPYYFFNFEDHIKVRDLLEAFLYKLKNEGCFEFFDRGPSTPLGSNMIFHKVNLEKLKEYRNKVFQEQDKNDETTNVQRQGLPIQPTKRELKRRLTSITQAKKFGKKEKAFLRFLSKDFKSKTIEEISREILTKDCKHLKGRVKKKIKGTGFSIRTIKASGWDGTSQYQLEYLPTPASPQQ